MAYSLDCECPASGESPWTEESVQMLKNSISKGMKHLIWDKETPVGQEVSHCHLFPSLNSKVLNLEVSKRFYKLLLDWVSCPLLPHSGMGL